VPWYKVDDGLSMKAETTRIPRKLRTSAIGLLTLAGSWSARELTDGHIPVHMLEELCGTTDEADWLVTAGFWNAVEDGWRFVEWAPEQPLREVVLADRAKKASKMKDWRARNHASNPATGVPTGGNTEAATGTPTDSASDSSVTPAPTQTHPKPSKELVQKPAHEYSDEFDEFWSLYPRKQGKADALRAYNAARKTTEAKALRDGAQAYNLLHIGEDKNYLKLPAGWLRDRRWEDETIPPSMDAFRSNGRPATRTEQNLNFVAQLAMEQMQGARDPDCDKHPGYPAATPKVPCAACERAIGLADGVAF
jgi:hypothetical protein